MCMRCEGTAFGFVLRRHNGHFSWRTAHVGGHQPGASSRHASASRRHTCLQEIPMCIHGGHVCANLHLNCVWVKYHSSIIHCLAVGALLVSHLMPSAGISHFQCRDAFSPCRRYLNLYCLPVCDEAVFGLSPTIPPLYYFADLGTRCVATHRR